MTRRRPPPAPPARTWRAPTSRSRFVFSVALAMLVMGCGVSSAAPVSRGGAPAGCPRTAPKPVVTTTGSGLVLIDDVVAMRLCRYGILSQKQRLERQHITRSTSVIANLVKQLNALPPRPAGPTACPAINGSEILVLARSRNGQAARVVVELSGCHGVTGGRVAKSALNADALIARLQRLTA